jgi:hypothetical protein
VKDRVFLQIKTDRKTKSEIVAKAKEEGCSISDFCLSKILGLKMSKTPDFIEYTTRKYTPKRKQILIRKKV